MSHTCESSVLFKILPVRIYGNNERMIDTFAFLDDGSSLTLIEESLATKLDLNGTREVLQMQWTKGITREENSLRTSLLIGNPSEKQCHRLKNVYTMDGLELPSQTVDVQLLTRRYPHLKGLPLTDYKHAKPQILIGLQHTRLLVSTDTHQAGESDPVATKTHLGWVVFGNSAPPVSFVALNTPRAFSLNVQTDCTPTGDKELHSAVTMYFLNEGFGVTHTMKLSIGREDEQALCTMERSLKNVSDRHKIGLLWKDDHISSRKGLLNTDNRLKNFKERLIDEPWPRVWYNLHFIVFNQNKLPPQPRSVISNLRKGPGNVTPLLGGLLKLRERAVAMNADIRQTFLQAKISPEDQQCLYRNCDTSKPPTVFIMQSKMSGPTSLPPCAQFIKNRQAQGYKKVFPEATEAISNEMYVDGFFNSYDSAGAAVELSNEAIAICRTRDEAEEASRHVLSIQRYESKSTLPTIDELWSRFQASSMSWIGVIARMLRGKYRIRSKEHSQEINRSSKWFDTKAAVKPDDGVTVTDPSETSKFTMETTESSVHLMSNSLTARPRKTFL